MNRRRNNKTRPSRTQRAFARSNNHRRLRLERYEPRLALSSISFVNFDFSDAQAIDIKTSTTQGGYINIGAGDFLVSKGNDFSYVVSGAAIKFPLYGAVSDNTVNGSGESPTPTETFDPWQGPADVSFPSSDAPLNGVSPNLPTTSGPQSGVNGGADLTADTTTGGSQTIPDPRTDLGKDPFKSDYPSKIRTGVFTKSAEIADELSDPFASVSAKSNVTSTTTDSHLESLFSDLRETMAANATEISEDTNLSDAAPFDSEDNLSAADEQPGISERLMLSTIDGNELDLSADQQADQADTQEIAEGGAIDVAATVNQARTEHEARAFEAVATLLNEQGVVDELTTPAQQPLVGELARAVALEMASFEGTALPIHSEGAVNRRGSAGAEVDAGIPLSYQDEETAQAETSTFSVAPWPLMFRAALGTAIVVWRRKTKPSADPNSGCFEPKDE